MCKEINDHSFDEAIKSEKNILVDFFTPWCKFCPTVEQSLEKLSESGVKTFKVDISKSPSTASKYSIMSVPTVMAFKDGEASGMLSGVREEKEYQSLLD
jgi:thioredoxin 1